MARCQEVVVESNRIASEALKISDEASRDRFWVILRAEVDTLGWRSDNHCAFWPNSTEQDPYVQRILFA